MKLEVNNGRKARKFTNIWKLSNILLNNQWVRGETKKKTKKYLETNENGNTYQSYGMLQKQF